MQFTHRISAAGLERIGHRKQGQHLLVGTQQHHRFAFTLQQLHAPAQRIFSQAQLIQQSAVAQVIALPVNQATDALAGLGGKLGHLQPGQAARTGQGARYRVFGARRQAGGQLLYLLGRVPAQQLKVGLFWAALGQGAGLVQRHQIELAAQLQVGTALDQNAAPGTGGQRADNGHRCRDHQRAGTGDHQQHQRAVNPVQPQAIEQQRRHYRNQQRQQTDRRGITGSKAVNQPLSWRTLGLSLLHRLDDARQGGAASGGRAAVNQTAVLVDGTGVEGCARLLVDRHALTGDGRLIHA